MTLRSLCICFAPNGGNHLRCFGAFWGSVSFHWTGGLLCAHDAAHGHHLGFKSLADSLQSTNAQVIGTSKAKHCVGELQSESLELKLRVPRTHHINHTNHINHINRIESYPSHILSTHPNLDHWLAVVLSPWFWATGHHLACECCCCRTIRLPGYLECLTYCVEVLSSQPGPAAWVSTIKSYRRGEHCITGCAVVKLTMHSEICRCQICVSLQ